jgi:hypothetical protein
MKTLGLFEWTSEDAEGFNDTQLEEFNAFNEIDLSDKKALELVEYIKNALDNGHHVSLSLK